MRLIFLFCIFNFIATLGHVVGQDKSNFYETDRVAELRLTFKNTDWTTELDSLRLYGNDLLLGKAKIDGKDYNNVGVRYRGRRSFKTGSNRNALHIKLNFIDRSQNHQGYRTIKLSNALRDPSMVREVLGFEIARKYMPAPQANYVKVYVNNKYYGLFINVESVSDQFLDKNFGSNDNTFFECNPDLDKAPSDGCKKNIFSNLEYEKDVDCYFPNYELKSAYGWDDLMELTKVLNETPEKINNVLNVDRALWMLAFNNVLVNLSSYSGDNSQNYYLYKDSKGQFNPIIWDLNLAFGSYKNVGGGSDLDLAGLQKLDPLLHEKNPAKPLISKLLANEDYKKIYLSHVRTILNENFRKGQYLERAKELQRLINVPLYEDKNRYYEGADYEKSLTSTVGKRSKIPGISELMEARASFLKKHPEMAILPVEVSEITVESRANLGQAIENFTITARVEKFAKIVKLMYRFAPMETYKSMVMLDDGKHNDSKAGDSIFGVTIKPAAGIETLEYYIVAENKGTVTYFPSTYMFNALTTSLEDLNN